MTSKPKPGWDNAHVLNGIVKKDADSSSGSDVGVVELEYEFIYSVSEVGDDDRYMYDIETYPTIETIVDTSGDERDECDIATLYRQDNKQRIRPLTSKCSTVSFDMTSPKIRNYDTNNHADYEKFTNTQRCKSAGDSSKRTEQRERKVRPQSGKSTKRQQQSAATNLSSGSANSISAEPKTGSIKRSNSTTNTNLSEDKRTGSACSNRHKQDFQENRQRRQSVSYDPALEKASAFLHGGGKNFSRANTSVTPIRYGLKHLQMNYTESNLQNNDSVIFLDLLKQSHQKNYIRGTSIRNIEARLEIKRKNPHYFTSFYEHKKLPDPLGRDSKKSARSVAQKKLERKKKIKSTTDELLTGYVPTCLTMKIAEKEEVEDIGRNCRYLRCRAPPRETVRFSSSEVSDWTDLRARRKSVQSVTLERARTPVKI